jgi:ribonuclease III
MRLVKLWFEKLFQAKSTKQETASHPAPTRLLQPEQRRLLDELIQMPVRNEKFFVMALTHRSAIDLQSKDEPFVSNERLEFLGDAALDLVVAEHLYKRYPEFTEGGLTKLRSQIVNAATLAAQARKSNLGKLLIVSESAEQNGVRSSETALADAFEAVIGAIYLDGGYSAAQGFLERTILNQLDFCALLDTDHNFKSLLLEFAQANRLSLPYYFIVQEDGPSHKKHFTIGVRIGAETLGEGQGKSKKIAEQLAAKTAIEKLRERLATKQMAEMQAAVTPDAETLREQITANEPSQTDILPSEPSLESVKAQPVEAPAVEPQSIESPAIKPIEILSQP